MAGQILALFRVDGRARTKGSLRAYCRKDRRHTVHLEEETKDSSLWRRRVAHACQKNQLAAWGKLLGYAGPVEVRLAVYFPRTLSRAKDAAEGAIIPSHDTPFPTAIDLGDTDKLQRNTGDALEDSRLILDDSQITDWMASKRWAPDGVAPYVEVMVLEAERPDEGPWWMPLVTGGEVSPSAGILR